MEKQEFKISAIGNTDMRTTLGPTTSVEIFRIVRTSLGSIISLQLGKDNANKAIYSAGKAVGGEVGRVFLSEAKELEDFVQKVRDLLITLKIGVLSVVSADVEKGKFVVRVDECVSCSGTTNIGEAVCYFEGGVIAGIMKFYLKKEIIAIETKCYGLGDNFCEFDVTTEE